MWMFLGWLNQLVAVIRKAEGKAVFPVLSGIASQYPQALIHPLRLGSCKASLGDSAIDRQIKDKLARYESIDLYFCNGLLSVITGIATENFGKVELTCFASHGATSILVFK